MKSIRKIASGLALGLLIMGFASCKKDEVTAPTVKAELKVNKVTDLVADKDETTVYYSLALNKKVTEKDDWDLSFTSTTIATKGTAQLVEGVFSSYVTAPTTGYSLTTIAGNGTWYTYNPTTHIISPIAGKIILVKTSSGKYAKIEMLSYYKGNPTIKSTSMYNDSDFNEKSRYYTFNYVYQPDGSTDLK